ncbi:hypothetical protein BC829DRAFT_412760 [Chytridium lagenaria]|nr:hypothetical protein BC829DRAFT_412760 [Chytridium lagenaria]
MENRIIAQVHRVFGLKSELALESDELENIDGIEDVGGSGDVNDLQQGLGIPLAVQEDLEWFADMLAEWAYFEDIREQVCALGQGARVLRALWRRSPLSLQGLVLLVDFFGYRVVHGELQYGSVAPVFIGVGVTSPRFEWVGRDRALRALVALMPPGIGINRLWTLASGAVADTVGVKKPLHRLRFVARESSFCSGGTTHYLYVGSGLNNCMIWGW